MVEWKFSGFLKFDTTPGGGNLAGIFDKSIWAKSMAARYWGEMEFCLSLFLCHRSLQDWVFRQLNLAEDMSAHNRPASDGPSALLLAGEFTYGPAD